MKRLTNIPVFVWRKCLNQNFQNYEIYRIRKEIKWNFFNHSNEHTLSRLVQAIDHIAISENFITNMETEIGEWNLDKKLSDHKGIYVELKNKSKMSESEFSEL